jgi:hypothetical protein
MIIDSRVPSTRPARPMSVNSGASGLDHLCLDVAFTWSLVIFAVYHTSKKRPPIAEAFAVRRLARLGLTRPLSSGAPVRSESESDRKVIVGWRRRSRRRRVTIRRPSGEELVEPQHPKCQPGCVGSAYFFPEFGGVDGHEFMERLVGNVHSRKYASCAWPVLSGGNRLDWQAGLAAGIEPPTSRPSYQSPPAWPTDEASEPA